MLDIIAGERADIDSSSVEEVFEGASVPGHVSVVRDWELDAERYAEGELSDVELLALAAEEALEAHRGRRLGGPVLDEVALRRAERRARQAEVARALRTAGGAA